MPIRFPDMVGKPYRPSNGTEGMIFMAKFCDRCIHDDYPDEEGEWCEILSATQVFDTNDPEYPKEWIFNSYGKPVCTKFQSR